MATRSDKRRPRRGKRTPSTPGYHHGDLRRALLDAAESVLEDAGIEGFTLRECARRAGVSHGAPAHHFGDARGLLTEFTTASFEQLATLTRTLRDKAPGDAYSQLLAGGLAYVEYALTHPARFQLMFRSERLDHGSERLAAAGNAVYAHLVESMQQVNAEAGGDPTLVAHKTLLAWSLVHGFASLMIDNAGFARQVDEQPGGALSVLEQIIRLSRPAFESRTLPAPATARRRPS